MLRPDHDRSLCHPYHAHGPAHVTARFRLWNQHAYQRIAEPIGPPSSSSSPIAHNGILYPDLRRPNADAYLGCKGILPNGMRCYNIGRTRTFAALGHELASV